MADRSLKLYIDSTSLSVIHQVADFVACAEDMNVVKIMTWLRNPLGNDKLKQFNAAYVKQVAAVSAEFIAMVLQLVERMAIRTVEIHSNHHHARRGVLPVLQALVASGKLGLDAVRLQLYDDGTLSIVDRNALAMSSDVDRQLQAAEPALRSAIMSRQAVDWSHAVGYAWHHIVDTRYHMLRPELTRHACENSVLMDHLGATVEPMRFDHAERLSPADWQRYLGMFELDDDTRTALRAFCAAPDAFLYSGTGVWDKTVNLHYKNLQKSTIAALRSTGVIRANVPTAYKGHPVNTDHDTELMGALGDTTIRFPARVPSEVLMMDGLLPARMGGLASSSFITLPKDKLDFVLCDADTVEQGLQDPMIAWMVQNQLIDADKLLPWQH